MGRALIVNDNKFITDRTAGILEDMGWEVHTAVTATLAYKAWVACRPDLLIVDTDMSCGKALDVIAMIRREDKDLVIIAATRGGYDDQFRMIVEFCGANKYVVGPLSASRLRNALEDLQAEDDPFSGPA